MGGGREGGRKEEDDMAWNAVKELRLEKVGENLLLFAGFRI